MFEVAEGGFLDIDVKVYNPVNKIMYDQQRETSGKVKNEQFISVMYFYYFR